MAKKSVTADAEYKSWISDLKKRFKSGQIKAAIKVNSELIKFYWSLGKDIVLKQAESKWGSGFFESLSSDLRDALPDVKGFSVTNLKYMKYVYNLFRKEMEIRPQLVDELSLVPWGHIRYIVDACRNNPKKALFFVHKVIDNHWSRTILLNFLDTDLYERQGKAVSNFSKNLSFSQGELAQQLTKDPYNFDFITVTERYEEKELKDALIHNIEKFLLELGRGFAYMGREFRLQIGQLGTYVTAVNHILKKDGDNPTVGLLICKTKDNILAQYALESMAVPIGISEYELSKLYPADFKSSLPSIKEIESKLNG